MGPELSGDANDEFIAAFNKFNDEDDGEDTTPIPDPVETPAPAGDPPAGEPAPEAPPAEAPAPAPAPAVEPGADPDGAPAVPAPAPASPAPAEPSAQPAAPAATAPSVSPADEVLNRLAGLINNQPTEPAPTPQAEKPIYTTDEVNQLLKYEEDWPDVAQAELLRRRAEYRDLVKMVYENVASYVEPLFALGDQLAQRQHETDLAAKVPDYQTVTANDVAAWIGTQPAFLQPAYRTAMQSGTAEDVAHLIQSYRQANPAPAPASAAPAPTVKPELSSAAKQAARALAPVSSDRTVVPAEDAVDFKSAFDRYAAEQDG